MYNYYALAELQFKELLGLARSWISPSRNFLDVNLQLVLKLDNVLLV
jgi:hypothetical protein